MATNQISANPALLSTGDWSFPIRSVTRAGRIITIDFAAINTSPAGYSNNNDTDLATINFKVNRAATTNPLTLTFDGANTQMLTKSGPTDILAFPQNATYTLITDTTPPSAVTNLSNGTTTTTTVPLVWTAPSDTGPVGKAASYDLRYSTSNITTVTGTMRHKFLENQLLQMLEQMKT